MGNISTVKILNDYVGEIENDVDFSAALCQFLRSGQKGQVVPGVTITDFRHCDDVKNYNLDSNDVEQILNKYEAENHSKARKDAIYAIRVRLRELVARSR